MSLKMMMEMKEVNESFRRAYKDLSPHFLPIMDDKMGQYPPKMGNIPPERGKNRGDKKFLLYIHI